MSSALPSETIIVHTRTLACDGGGGALGHPRVWLRIPETQTQVICPYCSRVYGLEDDLGTEEHGMAGG